MFGTLQDRLPKEPLAGIRDIDAANRFIREVYLPAHNARFGKPPAIAESAFVTIRDAAGLIDILCVEEERVVARDNTVAYAGLRLQLPQAGFAPTTSRPASLRQYPDATLAVFHGPRLLARAATGQIIEGEPLKAAA